MKAGWYGKVKRTIRRWMKRCMLSKHFSHRGYRNTLRDVVRRDTPMDTLTLYEFIPPLFQALREGGDSLTQGEMVEAVARMLHLPDAVMERRHTRYPLVRDFDYCLAWAQAFLTQSGISHGVSKGCGY